MQFQWATELSNEQYHLLKNFYYTQPLVHLQQFPGWNIISQENTPVSYCIAKNGGTLEGYTMVYEYKGIFAEVKFGPLSISSDVSIKIILEVIHHYKSRGFLSVKVLLGIEAGSESTLIQYSLYRGKKFKWYFDENNWSTLLLKLDDKTEDELLKHFTPNHRRSIKKAQKYNLICRELLTPDEIIQFAEGSHRMYDHRKIEESAYKKKLKSFNSIFEWLKKDDKGFFLGVFEEDKMIGGKLILIRNHIAESKASFALRDERGIPIGHFCTFHIMKILKQKNISYLDMGGYNVMVDKKSQIYQINEFKKGFNADYFFYPPNMYFDLKPMGYRIVRLLKKLKELLVIVSFLNFCLS